MNQDEYNKVEGPAISQLQEGEASNAAGYSAFGL
ncbi:hypothetical protein SAMN05216175_10613 [Neptunomonas qingdaonensis]|uniref:Uncharacterized protein n=1 Tax=Neptunomonas qingdaonensis TaxID=1045558 RepID=A0A1I2RCN2_9GAMM|nr:hypothetical protein SAMN05216175_10613 [Neptunomonas qingdaonensis]